MFLEEKINPVKVVEKTDTLLIAEISVPPTSPYFDGHFPKIRILPGVAETEIVVNLAAMYFGTSPLIAEIKRLKFTNYIMPDVSFVLRMEKNNNSIAFKITSPDTNLPYSQGTLIAAENQEEK